MQHSILDILKNPLESVTLVPNKTRLKPSFPSFIRILMKFIVISILIQTNLFSCYNELKETYLKDKHYNFLNASMVGVDEKNPLYKLSNTYASHQKRIDYFNQIKKNENIKAWQKHFQNKFSEQEIEAIFYAPNAIKKSYKKFKEKKEYASFAQYLSFLNSQNAYAQNNHENIEYDYTQVVIHGLVLLQEEKDPFFKERYIYLLMRLYHHKGQYQKTLDLYEEYKNFIPSNSLVKEWIDALRAGAYQHLKQNTKANQLYGKIFQNHKTNPHLGYYDFKIHSDKEWLSLMKTTKNSETKALYHFLRAMNWKNEPLFEFAFIAGIAPKSPWFERLSYMLMQEFQQQHYDIMIYKGKKDKKFKNKVTLYKLQKKRFLHILNKIKEPSFFTLYAKFYLTIIDNKSPNKKELEQLKKLANDQEQPYVALLNYLHALHQLSSISLNHQNYLYTQLKPLLKMFSKKKQKSILRYTALQHSTLYLKRSIKTDFSDFFATNKEIQRGQTLKLLNFQNGHKFQAYIEKNKRSFLDKIIFQTYMKTLYKNDVAKILSTLYMQDNKFQEAQFYLRQVPRENIYTPYNPFNATFSGDNRTLSKKSYSQREFAETMLRIEETLKRDPKSAQDYFLYANGLYNKSWFGNFPMSSVFYRDTTIQRGRKIPKTTNLRKAENNYLLAFYYTKDHNFRAKITYQLLKIKLNRILLNAYKTHRELWKIPSFGTKNNGTKNIIKLLKESADFTEAMKDFKADYAKTTYGKEVIKNCVTFQYF